MHKKKRIRAGIISVFLIVALALSTVFIVKEANHHCAHDNCEVCSCLSMCKKIANEFSCGLVSLFGFTKKIAWIVLTIGCITSILVYHTLVKLKVKLTI